MKSTPKPRKPSITALQKELRGLREEFERTKNRNTQSRAENATLTIYSAEGEACIGMNDPKWHKIVCLYEGNKCLGPPRPHWRSSWKFTERGFTLDTFLTGEFKGWRGYGESGELKYDQLPREVVLLHINTMREFLKTLSYYLPAHISMGDGNIFRP